LAGEFSERRCGWLRLDVEMAHGVVRERRYAHHRQSQATHKNRESSLHEFPREVSLRAVYGCRRVTGLKEKDGRRGKNRYE
jgi:hypothetical protein